MSRWLRAATLGLILIALAPPAARGDDAPDEQESQFVSYAVNMESPPALERQELQSLLVLVKLTPDQTPLVDQLFDSYRDRLKKARTQFGTWYKHTFMPDGQWKNDPELWKKSQPVTEKYQKHCAKLRASMLEDLKLLLSPEQTEQWPRLEARLKRRDVLSGSHTQIGFATIDVEDLARRAMGDAPLPPEVVDALGTYQDSVDRAVKATESFESKIEVPAQNQGLSQEEWVRQYRIAMVSRQLEEWKPLRDINLAAFKRVLPLLPEDRRDRFRVAFYSTGDRFAGYTSYGLDGGGDGIDFNQIERLKGLTDQQKADVAKIRADFDRQQADKLQKSAEEYLRQQDGDLAELVQKQDNPADWTTHWMERQKTLTEYRARLSDVLTESQAEAAGLGKKPKKNLPVPKFDE